MKTQKKHDPQEMALLRDRLNNGRCSIRKLAIELYGSNPKYAERFYSVLNGNRYDLEILAHLYRLADYGNVTEIRHCRGGGRPHRKRKNHLIQCKCPRCEELYFRNSEELNWTNPVIKLPRIYCDSCLRIINPPEGDKNLWESYDQLREEEFQGEKFYDYL